MLTTKIKKVKAKENNVIVCEFDNGRQKKYDMTILIKKYAIFKKLENNRNLFNQVSVDIGGYGVSWNEEIDLAAEEIWENGEEIE